MYIGQSKTGFKNESFRPHKLNHYHDVVNNTSKGTPILLFVARRTTTLRKFSSSLSQSEIDFVEQRLIGLALENNRKLKNSKNVNLFLTVRVPGVLNNPAGMPSAGARILRYTLSV